MKLHDEDDMEDFITEQKQRLARDREVLENNPTSAVNDYDINESFNPRRLKEQQPNANFSKPNAQPNNNILKTKPPTPQFLKLGQDYEKQKEKLKEELRKEYREALAEKQVKGNGLRRVPGNQPTYETKQSDLGLSLPIRDHLSAKERLALQRNKEYNEFLKNKENEESLSPRRLKTWATPVVLPHEVQQLIEQESQTNGVGQTKQPTVSESYQDILDRKRKQEKAYRNIDDEDELEDKVLYREKLRQRIIDDNDYNAPRKAVRFPQNRRRAQQYEDDEEDSLDSEETELIRRIRKRREGRRSRKYEEDSDEEDALFEKVKHKNVRSVREQQPQQRRLNSAQGAKQSQKSRTSLEQKAIDLRSRSAPPEEYTGLNIGHVPSANTVQRRKDEYKLELQRQMEDNIASKKRNRALELQAPEANNQGPRLDNNSSRKPKQSNLKSETRDEPKRSKKSKKQTSFRTESSESESEEDRRKSSKHFPKYYSMPPQHPSFYPPQAPQQFHSPYDEAYYYYGARNPLDPGSMAMPYAQPPGMVPPAGFPNGSFNSGVSPMMTAAQSRMQEQGSAEHQNSKLTAKSSRGGGYKMANIESSLVSDETRDTLMKREKMLTYQEELKEQMKLKEKKKSEAKLEQERYDQKMENEAKNYNPWGKGGGGAPMRDVHGNLVSDLRQMHLVNEDLVRDPSKVVELVKEQQKMKTQEDLPIYSPREKTMQDSDSGGVTSPRFGRSNPFEVKETSRQKTQRDLYKEDLQRQIDERKRIEAKRKEQAKEEEEREERKILEQNKKLQEEYELEKTKQREKIEEKLRQNAELQKNLEEKKKLEHQQKLEEQQRRDDEIRAQNERELQEKLHKPTSPPIHSKQLHGTQNLPRTPINQNTHRSERQEPNTSSYNQASSSTQQQYTQQSQQYVQQQQYTQQPQYSEVPQQQYQQLPLPANVRPPKSRESKRISRELSALRKQLLSEQRRVENELKTQEPVFQFGGYRPTKLKTETLVDLSKVRQRPVQVRRPTTSDRPSSTALKDFKEIKHGDDTESLRMFRVEHPDTPSNPSALEKQQEDLIKTQTKKLNNLRKGISEPQLLHSRRSPTKDSRNGFTLLPPSDSYASLLDADTMMIPVVDNDVENRPPSSELLQRKKYSARERRRSSRRNADEDGGLTYRVPPPDTYSLNSLTSLATLDVDRMASKNQERLNKLKALTGDEISLTDPDDILDRFVNQQKNDTNAADIDQRIRSDAQSRMNDRPSSVNTLDTEPWLRPGTGPIAAT